MKRVITFGTFDLLHEGHIKILERARAKGDYLIVGISTDALNAFKGKSSMFSQQQRRAYLDALEMVDETFFEESLELKDEYIKQHRADTLVMGDDWEGKFDWVSCAVEYLPRTPDVSSTALKSDMLRTQKSQRILFGDTYVRKHYDCALAMINEMTEANIAPIFTQTEQLPENLDVDCIVYFNKPGYEPPPEYDDVPRVCIDHGASNLKWFLASNERYRFFDRIITAGPDHSKALITFFPQTGEHSKVHSAGFIKTADLLSPPKHSREEICSTANLDPGRPITLFVPTWYVARNVDIQIAINEIASLDNHVAILHPETAHIDASALNVLENSPGIVTEMMKHADCVVSDLSSTIFEAAPLGKPVVQILMREYSDNGAKTYDFPYVAGTADLFCGGLMCRPEQVRQSVESLFAEPQRYQAMLEACQQRILHGTVMNDEVSRLIISELLIACKEPRAVPASVEEVAALKEVGVKHAHDNLAFNRSQIIAHGGGNFQKHHASNSREAVKAAFRSVRMVEVDLVQGADNIFLAHNGFEEKYGFEKTFDQVTTAEFAAAKFNGELTTLNLDEFFEVFMQTNGLVVFDIKNTDEEYAFMVEQIYTRAIDKQCLDRIVVQAYTKRDFEILYRLGFKRSILAVWKYFYLSPLGPDAHKFIQDCLAINEEIVYGISIPYYNHHMPAPSIEMDELLVFYGYWKRVFIHGAPQGSYPDILRRNLGIFADAFKPRIEFRQTSGKFAWRQYMFLNPALVENGIDNQVSATCHYIEWGEKEGRLVDYEVPKGFDVNGYVVKNPELRLQGVAGADSAKAHWTRSGSKQNREF